MDFKELQADLDSYPIMGALRGGGVVNIPLISHIHENFYLGGCIDNVDLGDYFSHVFSMYDAERYIVADTTQYHQYTMYDSVNMPIDVETVERVSDDVVSALTRGERTLLNCQAGINRSSMVGAITLVKWLGIRPSEAVMLLGEKRNPVILSNSVFREWVLRYGEDA